MIPLELVKKSSGHEVFTYDFDSIKQLDIGSDAGLDVICDGILTGSPYVYE